MSVTNPTGKISTHFFPHKKSDISVAYLCDDQILLYILMFSVLCTLFM